MSNESKTSERVSILQVAQHPLSFFALVVLVVEGILALLAGKATGWDFTILLVSMVGLLFALVIIVARYVQSGAAGLKQPTAPDLPKAAAAEPSAPAEDAQFLKDLLPRDVLKTIETDAREHPLDHIRIACAHTIWSCRPDLARPLFEDAREDAAEAVRDHAKAMLQRFYTQPEMRYRTEEDAAFLRELLPQPVLKALETEARTHSSDHVRIACAHTLWSCRPDLAKAVLEGAKDDWNEQVRDHAKALLRRFYTEPQILLRSEQDAQFLRDLLPQPVLKAIEKEAREHDLDCVRIACAHTLWSCRPDLAKAVLEGARDDWNEQVRDHAKALLQRYYG